ncbi:MAG: hypothetical protein RRY36_09920, partial [Bacteroidaceae bacterium]
MQEEKYIQLKARKAREQEIYRLYTIDHMKVPDIMKELGVPRSAVYRALTIFERENPQEAALMKRQGKDATPEDYKELLQEIAKLKQDLSVERLRADFYEEMVAYSKEVYGIDLK